MMPATKLAKFHAGNWGWGGVGGGGGGEREQMWRYDGGDAPIGSFDSMMHNLRKQERCRRTKQDPAKKGRKKN